MKFNSVYIENKLRKSKGTLDILSRIAYKELVYIRSYKDIISSLNFEKDITKQKKNLIIAENKGSFIKKCIRDKENIIRNEYFLYLFTGCIMDCEYCYLQDYLDTNVITAFINRKTFYKQLNDLLNKNGKVYIHAGEVTDPFIIERFSPYLEKLITFFSKHSNSQLEIRSKTSPPNSFYSLTGSKNIVISQTLAPEIDINQYEQFTSSIKKRLQILKRCAKNGFSIGLRFDPIIYSDDLKEKYETLFETVFSSLDQKDISSITIGALLFTRNLKRFIRNRFPRSNILTAEFIPDETGKIKYFLPYRKKIYKTLLDLLKKYVKGDINKKVSFCMDKKLEEELIKK